MSRLELFTSGKLIKSFIPNDLHERVVNPIPFITPSGVRAHGYEATLLADLCEAVLKAREAGALQVQIDLLIRPKRPHHKRGQSPISKGTTNQVIEWKGASTPFPEAV